MTMTTGEYELDATLRQTGEVNTPDLQYPVVTFSLLIVFLILMPILLINLLVCNSMQGMTPHPPPIGWTSCR